MCWARSWWRSELQPCSYPAEPPRSVLAACSQVGAFCRKCVHVDGESRAPLNKVCVVLGALGGAARGWVWCFLSHPGDMGLPRAAVWVSRGHPGRGAAPVPGGVISLVGTGTVLEKQILLQGWASCACHPPPWPGVGLTRPVSLVLCPVSLVLVPWREEYVHGVVS